MFQGFYEDLQLRIAIADFQFQNIIRFSYFIVKANENIKLLTFEWFTPRACNTIQINEINFYDKNKFKWRFQLKIEEKFQNFHKCRFQRLKISYFDDSIINNIAMDGFSTLGNATLDFQTSENDSLNRDFFIIGDMLNTYSDYNHFTSVIFFETYVLVVPPGQLYTNYEKVFLPFDYDTWLCLIATFAGAFLLTSLISLMPQKVRDLLYGTGVYTPSFNIISIFFGMGQVKLPSGNFARIILITFILFCLVIRNAYQGVQFEMLTKGN
jgi:hypothetical protein